MAESITDRLALPRWTADTDTPQRTEFDSAFENLEARAVGFLTGTLAARPAAAAGNARFVYEVSGDATATNNGRLFWSTGAAWIEIVAPTAAGSAGQVPTRQADGSILWSIATSGVDVIARTVLSADAASIAFASIPATYENLMVVLQGRSTHTGSSTVVLRFNGDTAANYDTQELNAIAAAVSATERLANGFIHIGVIPGATDPVKAGIVRALVPAYARTTLHKTVEATGGVATGTASGGLEVRHRFALWRSTAAINNVALSSAAGNLGAGTVATLYGMKGA